MDDTHKPNRPGMARRLVLALPLAAGGCSLFGEDFFFAPKPKLPGTRIALGQPIRGLVVDNPRNDHVVLPHPLSRDDWAQSGGLPSHEMGHAQVADQLTKAWTADIGVGGGYRRKVTAQPVVADGRVFTMDADAKVSGFDARTGKTLWRFDSIADDDEGTNVGGGIAVDQGTLYVANGRAEALALDPATGKLRWRQKLEDAARAAPTVAEGKLFIPLLNDRLVALDATDGHKLWSYQATAAPTAVLGLPSPAYADGLVVAGFGSGDLVTLRGATGAVIWADSLAATRGRTSIADLSAIRGLPVIQDGRVYAVGLGGLMLALDLRSGRRLWERDISSHETPCVAGDWIFVLSVDSQVAAISRIDGSVVWVTRLQRFANEAKSEDPITWQGPTLAADRLIIASSTGIAQAVSPYTGAILGEQKLSGPISVPPVVALGTVFVITDDGTLVALR